MTVWTVTSDTDNGLQTSVHASELAAYQELKRRFCNTTSEESICDRHLDAQDFTALNDYVQSSLDASLDTFSVESHELQTPAQVTA